ncbi:MAG: hypothetical protein RQ745_04830 [Longimicrobiales bacterium]|nr:hypothetical protein [Longimicrobiales bacterium]
MPKLKIAVIDLVARRPTKRLYGRVMNANFASVMPQVIAGWCEEAGHDVTYVCYTGFGDLTAEIPDEVDLVFIGAFTQAAQLAYALSAFCRSRGAVTVLGGPHARCYPEDAVRYFDFVLGFTHRSTIEDVLSSCEQHRPIGVHLSEVSQPMQLPGVRERWKFIAKALEKAPTVKIVPMMASLGCPYTCSFCIDSTVPYQPLDYDVLKGDLRFLLTKFKRPLVGWHDPNFGIRFNEAMGAIEEALPDGGIEFIAESSLSLLTEPHLKRLQANGFRAILPGIESWYDLGNKSKTGARQGAEKVRHVVDHINLINEYIPYIQANFVMGLESDEGAEPFELTKRFLDEAPASFPAFSLLSAFGRAAPLNLEYQRNGRVLGFPHHFLNNNHAMNVKPANYEWPEFYDHVIDLSKHAFSWKMIARRFRATRGQLPRWINVLRAVSSEGFGRIRYYTEYRDRLVNDANFRSFQEGESDVLPDFFRDKVKADLGPFWEWLPEGALEHDAYAYLRAERAGSSGAEGSLVHIEGRTTTPGRRTASG